MNRRGFLRRAGAAASLGGVSLLAGCSSSCPDADRIDVADARSLLGAPTDRWASPAGAWPVEHGTAGNTGYSPGSLPDARPAVAWRTRLELPDTDDGGLSASAPVVADGVVFVADMERVHALSLATGKLKWRSGRLGPTTGDAPAFEPNTVAPTVGPREQLLVGTRTGLVALDVADGTRTWDVPGLQNVTAPVPIGDEIYALGATTLLSLRPDGTERWRRQVDPTTERQPPAVTPHAVLVPTEAGIRAFDPQTGAELWTSSGRASGQVVATAETAFVGNYDGLHAVSLSTGEHRWTYDRGSGRAFRSPIVAPETIYTVEQPGEAGAALFALDRTDGSPSPRWCSYIGSGAVTAATEGQAIASMDLGTGPEAARSIVSLSRSRGAVRWALRSGSHPRDWVTPPAVLDGGLIVTTRGGTVVAVGGD